jgi:hypothetical protein
VPRSGLTREVRMAFSIGITACFASRFAAGSIESETCPCERISGSYRGYSNAATRSRYCLRPIRVARPKKVHPQNRPIPRRIEARATPPARAREAISNSNRFTVAFYGRRLFRCKTAQSSGMPRRQLHFVSPVKVAPSDPSLDYNQSAITIPPPTARTSHAPM